MLVSKKYAAGDIVSFKLVNGDEIVARIVSQDTDGWDIERPCTVIPSAQGMGLVQSLFTGNPDSGIRLSKEHIIMSAESIDAMQKHYLKTVTGIEPVTRGSIIT